jgi:transposase
MAYQEHGMWEVLDVLRRIFRGEGRRAIERATGRTRKTIGRYVRTAEKLGWKPGLEEPDEELATGVLERLRPGPRGVSPGESEKLLLGHKEQIRVWLDRDNSYKRGLKLTKVLRLLRRQGVEVSYSSLYRFAVKHFDFGKQKATLRMSDVLPGEVAEVDFGRMGLVYDPETGKKRVLHALVVTLVYSRHQYVHLTHTQKITDFIEGLEDAWEFFGGVAARVVLDNLKDAVLKANRYDPVFQRTFDEYANHRGFVIDSTVVRHATGKPHVERQVPYVRENFFRGEDFLSRDHAQREAVKWCLETAGKRIHGTTRKRPIEEFERFEKMALEPLKKGLFDTPSWAELKVHPDFCVRFNYALYTVPHEYRSSKYRGKKFTLRADSKLVRIFFRGKLIKTHPVQPPGGRSIDYNDYPPEKTAYAMRDVDYQVAQANKCGVSIGLFTKRLLAGNFPWAKLRQSQKLLRLADKYGNQRVDDACRRALGFDLINVKRVQRIIEKSLEKAVDRPGSAKPAAPQRLPQLPLRFSREAKSFNHSMGKEKYDGNQKIAQDGSQTPEVVGNPAHAGRQDRLCKKGET